MLSDFGKETKEVIEETVGRRGTRALIWVIWGGLMSVGLLAIGTLFVQVNQHVVSPVLLPLLSQAQWPVINKEKINAFLITLGGTFLSIGSVFLILHRWRVQLLTSSDIDQLEKRLATLEQDRK